MKREQKKEGWALTSNALELLIDAIKRDGIIDPAEEYLRIRASLVRYFETHGASADAEVLSDETLDRVAKQLSEEVSLDLRSSRAYFFAVARLVLLEHIRRSRRMIPIDDTTDSVELSYDPEAAADKLAERINNEIGLDAIRDCHKRLSEPDREMLEIYDQGTGRDKIVRRNALAAKLGKTKSTLIVAISRVRTKIKDCVRTKLGPDFFLEGV